MGGVANSIGGGVSKAAKAVVNVPKSAAANVGQSAKLIASGKPGNIARGIGGMYLNTAGLSNPTALLHQSLGQGIGSSIAGKGGGQIGGILGNPGAVGRPSSAGNWDGTVMQAVGNRSLGVGQGGSGGADSYITGGRPDLPKLGKEEYGLSALQRLEQMGQGQFGPNDVISQQRRLLSQQALEDEASGATRENSATSDAMDALAMKGGLTSGAAERLAAMGAERKMNSAQGVRGNLQKNLIGTSITQAQRQDSAADRAASLGLSKQQNVDQNALQQYVLDNNRAFGDSMMNMYNKKAQTPWQLIPGLDFLGGG